MKHDDAIWLSCFLDTEGCIHIAKYHKKSTPTPVYTLMVTFTSVRRDALERCRDETGGLGSITNGRVNRPENHQDCFNWQVSSKQATELLEAVYPWLRIKREHADIAFAFRATYGKTQFGRIVGEGTRVHHVAPEILYQREQYRTALFRLNGHKTKLGRPPKYTDKENPNDLP